MFPNVESLIDALYDAEELDQQQPRPDAENRAVSAPVQTTFPNSDVQVHTSIDFLDLSYMYRGFTAAV